MKQYLGDIEEDFTMIAEKSATLFDMTTEDEKEKIPFKFQTDFKKSSKQSNNENLFIVAKDKETRKADKLNHLEVRTLYSGFFIEILGY